MTAETERQAPSHGAFYLFFRTIGRGLGWYLVWTALIALFAIGIGYRRLEQFEGAAATIVAVLLGMVLVGLLWMLRKTWLRPSMLHSIGAIIWNLFCTILLVILLTIPIGLIGGPLGAVISILVLALILMHSAWKASLNKGK